MTNRKLKFLHTFMAKEIQQNVVDCLNEQPARSGMYNWLFVFEGHLESFWSVQDRLEEYDVIQVNMCPADMPIIPLIREKLGKNSKTKLVLNNDYVCEKWDLWDPVDPFYYRQIQKMGDMVFGTEPFQVSNMINGAFCLPHPTNTKYLKRLGTDFKTNNVGFMYHWWAGEMMLPAQTLWEVKKKWGLGSTMYGYRASKQERKGEWKHILFDKIEPSEDFPEFAQKIKGDRCFFDPNPCHTYGRNGVECACLRIPVIGSNRVFSYNLLFPELTVDPYDRKAQMEKFDLVLNGDIKAIMDRAYEAVEYFNYENSKQRFLEAFDIAIQRGGHDWYEKFG